MPERYLVGADRSTIESGSDRCLTGGVLFYRIRGRGSGGRLPLPVSLLFDSQADVKRVMAGWADQKPSGHAIFSLKHGVKPIPVTTGGTIPEFFLHFDSDNLICHDSVSTLRLKGIVGVLDLPAGPASCITISRYQCVQPPILIFLSIAYFQIDHQGKVNRMRDEC